MITAAIISVSVLSALMLGFCIYLFLIKPGKKRDVIEKYASLKYAHRGLHGDGRAENSLSAFEAACKEGCAIELDVRLSSDGVLVVFHDDTLERVTGESGRVDEKTAEELSKIKLEDTEDTVPTFSSVLSLVNGRVPLLVEIKEDAGKYGVTEKTVELLRDYRGEFLIESFNPLAIARVKKLMPDACRGILSQSFFKEKQYRSVIYLLLQLLTLNVVARPDFVAFNHLHEKNCALRLVRKMFGATTLAWTVRSQEEERRAYANGFNGIIFEGYIPNK